MKLNVNGKEYPLCMTINAAEAFENRYGEIAKLATAYAGKSQVTIFKEVIWQLARLLEGGRDYAALTSNIEGDILSEEELGILCPLSRTVELQQLVLEVVADGFRREVETEPDKKNAKTTQSKKR